MKSYNHKCITVCSLYISIVYEMIIILFDLQMIPTISLTALSAMTPTKSIVSHCIAICIPMLIIVYNIIIQWLNNYYYKTVFAHKFYYYAYDSNATSTFSFSCSEYTNVNAQLNSTRLD